VPARAALGNPFTWKPSDDEVFIGLTSLWPGAPEVIGVLQQQCRDEISKAVDELQLVYSFYASSLADTGKLYREGLAALQGATPGSQCAADLKAFLADLKKYGDSLQAILKELNDMAYVLGHTDCSPGPLSARPPDAYYKQTLARINNQVKQYGTQMTRPAQKLQGFRDRLGSIKGNCAKPGTRPKGSNDLQVIQRPNR
jgi:hypothetical protein